MFSQMIWVLLMKGSSQNYFQCCGKWLDGIEVLQKHLCSWNCSTFWGIRSACVRSEGHRNSTLLHSAGLSLQTACCPGPCPLSAWSSPGPAGFHQALHESPWSNVAPGICHSSCRHCFPSPLSWNSNPGLLVPMTMGLFLELSQLQSPHQPVSSSFSSS